MKWTLAVVAGLTASSCVTSAEYDRDQAFTACRTVTDSAERQSCMDDAIADAQRVRAAELEDYQDDVEAKERREAELEALGVSKKERRQSSSFPF